MLLLQPTTTQHPNLQIRRPNERYHQLTKKTKIKTRKKRQINTKPQKNLKQKPNLKPKNKKNKENRNSLMTLGMAVLIIELSRAPTRMPIINPAITTQICFG